MEVVEELREEKSRRGGIGKPWCWQEERRKRRRRVQSGCQRLSELRG